MCWGVPARIVSVDGHMAVVVLDGVKKSVSIELVNRPKNGEYVLVHAGFAVAKVDMKKARFTALFFRRKGKIDA